MKKIITGLMVIAMTVLTAQKTLAAAGAGYSQYKISQIEQQREKGIQRDNMEILKGQNGQNHR